MAMRGEEAFNPGLMYNIICTFVTSLSTMKTTTRKAAEILTREACNTNKGLLACICSLT